MPVKVPKIIRGVAGGGEAGFRTAASDAEIDINQGLTV